MHECHCILQLLPIWTTQKICANVTKHCKERDAGKQVAIILTYLCTRYLPKSALFFFKPIPIGPTTCINNVFDVEGNTGQLPTRYRVANLLLYWELMVAVPFILQYINVRKSEKQFFLTLILPKSRHFPPNFCPSL